MAQMIQYTDTFANERDALDAAAALADQIDFVAGRVLAPSDVKPSWRVQVLFQDCGHDLPLPDGLRRVTVPASVLRQFTAIAA